MSKSIPPYSEKHEMSYQKFNQEGIDELLADPATVFKNRFLITKENSHLGSANCQFVEPCPLPKNSFPSPPKISEIAEEENC